jgi:hypothetical protein
MRTKERKRNTIPSSASTAQSSFKRYLPTTPDLAVHHLLHLTKSPTTMLRRSADGSDPSTASIEYGGDDRRRSHPRSITKKERASQSQASGRLACDICRERTKSLMTENKQRKYRVDSYPQERFAVTGEIRNVDAARGLATTAAIRDRSDIVQLKRTCHVNCLNYRTD